MSSGFVESTVRHEHRGSLRAILFYGVVSLVVLFLGGAVLYTYFETRLINDSIDPEQLPQVTILTSQASDPEAASWVATFTKAEFSPTLVRPEQFAPGPGVIALCHLNSISPALAAMIQQHLEKGGGVAVLGETSNQSLENLHLRATPGAAEESIKVRDDDSPVLARVDPGKTFSYRGTAGAFLEERPEMSVDARWTGNQRAAIAHMNLRSGRLLWLGFDPEKMLQKEDLQFAVLLKTSLRWVAGQPISDAGIGAPAEARQLAPPTRMAARQAGLSFSIDRLKRAGLFSVRLHNRGNKRIANPTVKCWLPPNASDVRLEGSILLRNGVTLVAVPEEGAVLVTLPSLDAKAERLIKLRVEESNRG